MKKNSIEKGKLLLKLIFIISLVLFGEAILTILLTLLLVSLKKIEPSNISEFMATDFFCHLATSITITIYQIGCIVFFQKKSSFSSKTVLKGTYFEAIFVGIIFSLFYNLSIHSKPDLNTDFFVLFNIGITGPILEELLFRGYVFSNLCSKNETKISMWLTTILFAFTHQGILNILYAFLLGGMLMICYQKTKNLKVSIALHISANLATLLLYPIVCQNWIFSFFTMSLLLGIYGSRKLYAQNRV